MPPCDAERHAALTAALGALRDSWTVEHERYMRRGPQLGRTLPRDPVRVVGRERRAEMKRLRSMLDPRSGTPRPAAATWTANQIDGRLARSVQVVDGLASDYAAARSMLGRGRPAARRSGGVYSSTGDLNTEARRLLDLLAHERRDLRTAWERYARTPVTSYAERDRFDALALRLVRQRQAADLLAVELRAATRQRTPDARAPRATWTRAAIMEALDAYQHEHGRLPSKSDCNTDPALPAYTLLRRKLGPSPLSTVSL
jgi:hypothetical protein